jgi:hypothetical protein
LWPNTSLFLTVSQWHIYWSQNARFYTTLLLLFSLGLFLFNFGIEEDRPWYLVISLCCFGLAFQERMVAAFFVPIVVGYLLLIKLLRFEVPIGFRPRNIVLFFAPMLIGGMVLLVAFPEIRELSQWSDSFGFVNNDPIWIAGGQRGGL